MSSYNSVQQHRAMVFDILRNSFYASAIKKSVTSDSVALDLGAGLGIHGLIAACNGAKKTYLVDPSPVMKVTENIVLANGLSDKVICINQAIEQSNLAEKVDIIISVFTGNFLLTEDLLPSLYYARDNYLKDRGKLIPDRAIMEAVPVSAAEYYNENVSVWSKPINEVDFSYIHKLASNCLYYDGPGNMSSNFLADPVQLLELNFMIATEAACRNKVEVKIIKTGTCHGWLGWFKTIWVINGCLLHQ